MFDLIIGGLLVALSVGLCIFAAYAGTHGAKQSPFAIEASDAPAIFCPTAGCFLMADHQGCCGECDVCAQFGSHDAPVLEYVGKHANCTVDSTPAYYRGKHRA
jgi:hypothetical protein